MSDITSNFTESKSPNDSKDTFVDSKETEEMQDEDGELVLSHQEAMSKVEASINEIISTDPLLCDLPPEVTLEEINSFIALEHGQAIVVNVHRADGEVLSVVVVQNGTVLDLKHAIKRHMTLKLSRSKGKKHISWKYIWKRHWLYFDGQKLTEDKKLLKEYGIRNKDEVTFIKRLKEK
ncbi:U11/U12 small nuclear ribonucleoprotein 25 kDa protein-like [Ostrea edulis]|uniref:U11/U12 small nuclear ribonucleoprotein 25 kDa protein-like n=1 Tax=Ostrea edulis TaxID=37623 RepID=UPI0020952D29|nr:U11/U12 small nuclear ribonucleoprotein 25 kDa protein-like [Ostrea edulis]XP_055996305.1 U11/U12 small nuclear ribonucleoprotein 25 kDa protein-like [Ostrea edulis]